MSYVGIIVAAGASSRTGLSEYTSKAALRVAGRSLLEYQVDFLRRSGVERVFIVVRPEHVRLLARSLPVKALQFTSFIIADRPTGWAGEVERVLPFVDANDEVVLISCDNIHKIDKVMRLDGKDALFTYTAWGRRDHPPSNGPVFGRHTPGTPWREFPGPGFQGELFTGYVVATGRALRRALDRVPVSGRGEKEIVALLAELTARHTTTATPYEGEYQDIADLADLARVNAEGSGWFGYARGKVSIGACVLPFTSDRRFPVLTLREDGRGWVPPGGDVNPGERFDDAAIREAHEEVGVEYPRESLRLLGVYPTIGKVGEPACTVVFTAPHDINIPWTIDRQEIVEIKVFRPERIAELEIPFGLSDALDDFIAGRELDVR